MSDRRLRDPVGPRDHVRGPDDAAVTIVEYGDYDCPHTRAAQAVIDRLMAENPDVRIAFRHFPLRHLHENAEALARIAEAAAGQGSFWEVHDRFMRHRSSLDGRTVLRDLEVTGLDLDRLDRERDSDEVIGRVERDVRSGTASGVHSTPSFFFDGVLHDGHYDDETLARRLEAARRR